jgi:hypothetical protein
MTAQKNEQPKQTKETDEISQKKLTCGIIMPIATMSPEYTSEHWEDIRVIIDAAIEKAGFEPRIVSDSEDSTIIHKSIINNIYNDEIIVCDVSNKNANVMFELGMRLAFNKPVVIIKDNVTGYSLDTSNIQHLAYRKDLRHNTVQKFIDELAIKIKATHEAPQKVGHQSFLSHFGKFEVAKIENKSIEGSEALEKLLNKMSAIESQLSNLKTINDDSKLIKTTMVFNTNIDLSFDDIKYIKLEIKNNFPFVNDVIYQPAIKTLKVSFNNIDKIDKFDNEIIRHTINKIIKSHEELPF